MDKRQQELLARLSIGPSFLLLGQAFGELATGHDPVIVEAARRAGVSFDRPSFEELNGLSSERRASLYREVAALTRTAASDPWLSEVARHPWNGVFTSAIDGRVPRAFEADWRRVVPVAGSRERVRQPRSTTELKIRLLFGGVVLAEEDQPPLDTLDLAAQRRQARECLDELGAGLLTPRGILAIEGYAPWDWLEPADLFALVSQFAPGQVHLFSAGERLLANEFVRGAIDRGLLTAHQESLSLVLSEGEASGRLSRPAAVADLGSHLVRIGDAFHEISRDEWNKVIPNARPIDDAVLQPFRPASPAIQYQRFRSFLGATEGAPPWTAVSSGFPFERDFERDLLEVVTSDLDARNTPKPLLLAGQAASGKSTSLYSLAVKIARQARAAVLFVARRADRPMMSALDSFALWAEEAGAAATLLIWDGMTDGDDYFVVDRHLRSRGRRVLVVGSSYVVASGSPRTLTAPATLTDEESSRIAMWLDSFGVPVDDRDLPHLAGDSSFLAALYRFLPESRRGLEHGLNLELRSAEQLMEKLGRERVPAEDNRLGIMADALRRAGLDLPIFVPGSEEGEVAERSFAERSTTEQLTGLILVAGRRGLRLPLELVLRTLGRAGSTEIVDIVKRFDIIRWSEDESGDQYLGTRTALEAELLARRDFRDSRAEVEVLVALLAEIRPAPGGGGGPEVQFAVDLLARVGPDSDERGRFIFTYLEIADALKDGRAIPGRSHPRLMLVEANLRREYVKWAQSRQEISAPERLGILAEAEQVLAEALDVVPERSRSRLNLLVELASVLGAQAFELSADANVDDDVLEALSERIVNSALEARATDPENYYPVDVVAWVCMRLVDRGALENAERAGLIANALASFESVDADQLSPKQRAKYDSRRAQFALALDDPSLAEDFLRRLEQNQDPAAYFLLAMQRSGMLSGRWDKEGARSALASLVNAPLEVRSDWRCARLTLDLFWLIRTGQRFLQGEREVLDFDRDDWRQCLDILDAIDSSSPFDRYRADFLRGLALFHLGQARLALAVFDELDRATVNVSRRVIATYLASSPDGEPLRLTGEVRSITPDGRRGKVWIGELGLELPFIPYRFSTEPLERGDALPDFHVAFNMRGPYADPARTAQPKRSPTRP